jgi:integrase
LPMGGQGRDLTDEEFQALLRHSRQASFRRLILFLRLTGARPGEATSAQWPMVNWPARVLILAHHKTADFAIFSQHAP